ncbi:MAG: hypothetical protein KF861_24680 [Planctomycetaceae bacterium]|nr:hypothetical protein [Planctomycetaceae bacterium]
MSIEVLEAYRRGIADAAALSADLVEYSPADRQTLVDHLRGISQAVSGGVDCSMSELWRAAAPAVNWPAASE